jgi:GH25 family lysozyme M1 (1,4-beta-N-acetylmuramidase)
MALYGEDISRYQGTLEGQDFTIIRATAGNSYVDPTCDTKYQKSKADGKLLGVYHFAYPTLNDPLSEAAWFVSNVQGYLHEALLVLDFEVHTDVTWAKNFLDHVHALTGVRPLIYMSASAVTAVDWTPVAQYYGLWEAGYPNVYNVPNPGTPNPSGSDMPYGSGAWAFADIWQYSSSAGTLDKDVAYMTPDSWHKFAQGDVNAPTPTPVPTPAVPPPTPPPVESPAPEVPAVPSQPTPEPLPQPTDRPTVTVTPDAPADTSRPTPVQASPTPPKPAPEAVVIATKVNWLVRLWRWLLS